VSGEFDVIDTYFKPLADAQSHWLSDDCAYISGDKIISKDLLVGDVHFLANDPPAEIAIKALLSNLSDVISSGGRPKSYFLGLVLPNIADHMWLSGFAKGLAEVQQQANITLAGGDITRGQQVMISITMLAEPVHGWVRRDGAKHGDILCVTGEIGGAAVAVADLLGQLPYQLEANLLQDIATLRNRPSVPLGLEDSLGLYASAALDISDGLLGDAAHLARASGVRLMIYADQVPVHAGLRAKYLSEPGLRQLMLTGGDDFQTLFTLASDHVVKMRQESVVPFTVIGAVDAGSGVTVRSYAGGPVINLPHGGYSHISDQEG